MTAKPRLLVVSSVLPFPRNAGQQQRVYYTLKALRENFHLTFLTAAEKKDMTGIKRELLEVCDVAIVLPSLYLSHWPQRVFHKVVGTAYALFRGLKFSNYLTGEVEFSPQRLASALDGMVFDVVLFEYWHAFKATRIFRERGVPCILDMHDILWRSYARQLDARAFLPAWLKQWSVDQYKVREESAWSAFDVLIAINQDEYDYARRFVRDDIKIFYTPMGTDISIWSYCWLPAAPRRIGYYGSLGSQHNQQDALLCYREIMPRIWDQFPEVEFWIVGSNPPAFIKALERDKRVHVTGFINRPQEVLKTMALVLCPWSGTYGFRSRVVEVMALGAPVVASEDAVFGMGFEIAKGILLAGTPVEMASHCLRLFNDEKQLTKQSVFARRQIEEKFSYEATYVNLSTSLAECLRS